MEEGMEKLFGDMISASILKGTGASDNKPVGIFPGTKTATLSCSDVEFDMEKIHEIAEEVLKMKVNAMPNSTVEPGTIKIMNHEAIREQLPHWEMRGKTIMFNQKDDRVKQAIIEQGIYIEGGI